MSVFNQPLPLARYRFTARVDDPLTLPDYAGSLLRGQFGAALRHIACMTRQPTCPGCPLLSSCPYSRIFEAPPPSKGAHALQDFSQIPNPYVIEPPEPGARVLAPGDSLQFHLALVGHATDQLALVVFALQRALAQGLTRERSRASLQQVDWLDGDGLPHLIWTSQQPTLAAHPTTLTPPAPPPALLNGITLRLQTPLRLQNQGRPLRPEQLTPRTLVAALARRSALLMEFHAGLAGWGEAARQAAHLGESLSDQRSLQWSDWTRYSSRQRQEMTLGGVLGTWSLLGPADTLAELWPWLWLGQWLHVGKNATMGLGQYTLQS